MKCGNFQVAHQRNNIYSQKYGMYIIGMFHFALLSTLPWNEINSISDCIQNRNY